MHLSFLTGRAANASALLDGLHGVGVGFCISPPMDLTQKAGRCYPAVLPSSSNFSSPSKATRCSS